jgi:4-amino-4-deoxy-L-arabinose transferase-like glycosyltransferase
VFGDVGVLIWLATARFVLQLFVNGQYGFHRDELGVLDNARYLAWGYVEYPPFTPAVVRLALELFGTGLVGVRIFAALGQSVVMVLAGLMARDLGGRRGAQLLAAIATAIAPLALINSATTMYMSFDYLWWVVVAWAVIRLLKTENPRWWLAIGAAIGLGMMTKYTMGYLVIGLVGGVLLTSARRYLRSPWLWAGVGLSVLLFLPNLLWQVQHGFISIRFLADIHERDVRIGRTQGYLLEQVVFCTNPVTIPLWLAGLYFYFFAQAGRRFRLVGWLYVIPFVLFLVSQGRSYYLAPAYPMLLAGGAVAWQGWLDALAQGWARTVRVGTWALMGAGLAFGAALALPLAPLHSPVWEVTAEVHDVFREEIGWPELAAAVADIYHGLPAEERAQTAILTGNYGEAGAINFYGPALGLPEAISGINTLWLRGYGDFPPETAIMLGFDMGDAYRVFRTCAVAGQTPNPYKVDNEETSDHPNILLCREPLAPWPELWPKFHWFG